MKTSEGVGVPIDYKRITIGIPSYNEEENIPNLINSIIELNKLECQSANRDDNDNHGDDENDSNRSKDNGIDSTKDFVIT